MKEIVLTASLIAIFAGAHAMGDSHLRGHDIARIDPGKTLELIKRIKSAGESVAS